MQSEIDPSDPGVALLVPPPVWCHTGPGPIDVTSVLLAKSGIKGCHDVVSNGASVGVLNCFGENLIQLLSEKM